LGFHRYALKMIVSCWLISLPMSSPLLGAETREEAVAAAREGRSKEAIGILRKLLAEGSEDPLVAHDLAVILTWANRPREAADAFERAGAGEVPAYVLPPIIRAYRDQKALCRSRAMGA
jgi:Flp pilus assembly protein TadD